MSEEHDRGMAASAAGPAEGAPVDLDEVRQRGQRIKTWGIVGDIREQIEATGEEPIMYKALGTPAQTHHPFNLFGDIKSQPSALRELNDVLTKLLSGNNNIKQAPMGGVRAAAEILNFMSGSAESGLIESVKEYDADLAQKILDEMFVFENLLDIDDRGIQLLLREIQSESLIIALKGSSEPLREKLFGNMSQRAAEMLRDDLEAAAPARVSDVEGAQREILTVTRRLADAGEISLGGGGGDAFV